MATIEHPIASPTIHDGAVGLNHAQLLGSWRNTDAGASGGILRLVVTEEDGALAVRVFGTGRPHPYDWGVVEAPSYAATPTSTMAWAFRACYDLGPVQTAIAAYSKVGILILTTYNAFTEPRGRTPYWTREFFYREEEPPPLVGTPSGRLTRERDAPEDALAAPRVDLTPLVATWRSFDLGSNRVARLQVTGVDGQLVVRPYGVWTPRQHDWHEAIGSAYTEDVSLTTAVAFTAAYALDQCEVEMVGYVNRRLLTIETGTRFVNGSRQSPYFTREHLYPS
jgi:hypothetical protein